MTRFEIHKYNPKSDKWENLGIFDNKNKNLLLKGYKFNGLFYTRKNSMIIYDVIEM